MGSYTWNLIGDSIKDWGSDIPLIQSSFNNKIWYKTFNYVDGSGFKIRLTNNWSDTKHFGQDSKITLNNQNKIIDGKTVKEIIITSPGDNIKLNVGEYTLIYHEGLINEFINSGKIEKDGNNSDYQDKLFIISGNITITNDFINMLTKQFIVRNDNYIQNLAITDIFTNNGKPGPNVNELLKTGLDWKIGTTIKMNDNCNIIFRNFDLFSEIPQSVIFDGNNYNLTLAGEITDYKGPLWCNGGTIKNLKVEISGEKVIANTNELTGACGWISRTNVNVSSNSDDFINNNKNTAWGLIKNCSTNININNLGGGIVGSYAGYGLDSNNNFTKSLMIKNCYSTGSIGEYAGGICSFRAGAKGYCSIENCYSTGNIYGLGGGICSSLAGNKGYCLVNNCYSTGNISTNSILSGGICGFSSGRDGKCIIQNCFSTGTIGEYAGGISGSATAEYGGFCVIQNCYSTGSITKMGGGICGIDTAKVDGVCIIQNCYSTGSIGINEGGICGRFDGENNRFCVIQNCYSNGTPSFQSGENYQIYFVTDSGTNINSTPAHGNFPISQIYNSTINNILINNPSSFTKNIIPLKIILNNQWGLVKFTNKDNFSVSIKSNVNIFIKTLNNYPRLSPFIQLPWDSSKYIEYNPITSSNTKPSLLFYEFTNSYGDPYISTITGKTYKLSDEIATYRLFEGDNIIINAEVDYIAEEQQEKLRTIEKQLKEKHPNLSKLKMITNGVLYSKFYINNAGEELLIDMKSKKIHKLTDINNITIDNSYLSTNNIMGIKDCKCVKVPININSKNYGKLTLELQFYENPQIENGISISIEKNGRFTGLLADTFKESDMKIQNIKDLETKLNKNYEIVTKENITQDNEIWTTF